MGPADINNSNRLNVLVVDDDPSMRALMCATLQHQGHTVLTASDGAEALSITDESRTRIDVLVSDVHMPGMDGIALARLLVLGRPSIKVLLVSADTRREYIEPTFSFLRKPFAPSDLIEAVEALNRSNAA